MTRLTHKDLDGLNRQLIAYDNRLKKITGVGLKDIACFAAGIKETALEEAAREHLIGVVPITAGRGLISEFAESVQGIVAHLGFNVHRTKKTDVAGIEEALIRQARIVFMADDERFIALNTRKGLVIDNSRATARGYVSALSFLARGLKDQQVLVLGAGQVGSKAISFLKELDARIGVYDLDEVKTSRYADDDQVTREILWPTILSDYKYVVDATPEGQFMKLKNLHPEVCLAAPGIPLGLTDQAYANLQGRVIHDPLQIGVATMLAMAFG